MIENLFQHTGRLITAVVNVIILTLTQVELLIAAVFMRHTVVVFPNTAKASRSGHIITLCRWDSGETGDF